MPYLVVNFLLTLVSSHNIKSALDRIFNERKVLTLKANKLTIHAKNKPICCQGDGEIFGGGKIEYSVRKKALQFIY